MQFHLLSFEGPDAYSRIGGIASRAIGLSSALAGLGHETHLWFVGDPFLPGNEQKGALQLHRWCQWISRHHPRGVYDGEHGKVHDYSSSLPPYLYQQYLAPHLANGGVSVVVAEEWHTVHAVRHLDWLLTRNRHRARVDMLWNANGAFGLEAIDWSALEKAAKVTTVDTRMQRSLLGMGVRSTLMPNGIDESLLKLPDFAAVQLLQRRFKNRRVLTQVGPLEDDTWLTLESVVALKTRGKAPLLVARGSSPGRNQALIESGGNRGLRVVERSAGKPGVRGLLDVLSDTSEADVLLVNSHLDPLARRLLFRTADAVFSHTEEEVPGPPTLEAMAQGGITCTGPQLEGSLITGTNGLVLEREEPRHFVEQFEALSHDANRARMLRRAARATANSYTWNRLIDRALMPSLRVTTEATEYQSMLVDLVERGERLQARVATAPRDQA